MDSNETTTGAESTVVFDLAADCDLDDLDPDGQYLATVNGVVDYGVFVDLSDSVSGLVHESLLEDAYEVGDELVVRLDQQRDNGDLAFEPVSIEEYDIEQVDHDYDRTAAGSLSERVGETIHVEGEVVQVRQTGGPTVFQVRDETGIVPCAAFLEAGVRAHPDVDLGDYVHISGQVDRREDSVQIEVDTLERLEGDDADYVADRLDAAITEAAAPNDIDPLIDWPAFEPLFDDLQSVARLLRQTVLEGRPIRIRHHADGDGMCASVPVHRALERFIDEVHEDPDAKRHLLKRLPSKAPFYEMEDATRDLSYALEDHSRHGQQYPLLLMLDNGSTEEDTPAYETLRHYDIPIVVVDHHHPDPEAVDDLLTEHVNPYLHGEDYAITTGMLCVELARMIDPGLTDELEHVPAVAGLSDRSDADAMDDYLDLANAKGYDAADCKRIGDALDYAAHWLRYDSGRHLVGDVLNVGCDDQDRHEELVELFAEKARRDVDNQLDAALEHVEHEHLDNGAHLYQIDLEQYAHRFTYPAPGKTTGAIHDTKVEETGDPVITIGYGPDFAVLRSDGVRLDIPTMVSELDEEISGGGVSGGGHLVVGSIKYVTGRRDAVLDALVEKMAQADIDPELGSTTIGIEDAN